MASQSPGPLPCEVIILTALPVEYQATLGYLQDVQEVTHPEGTVYECGTFTGQNRIWRVVVAEIGMGGPKAASETERAISFFHAQIASQLQGLIPQVFPVLNGIINLIISVIVIAVLSIYFLSDGGRLISWLRYRTPLSQRENINFLLSTMHRTVGGYFRGLLLLSIIGAVSTGLMLALLGVPYAALLAVAMFVLLFIPVIGGTIAGLLCIVLSLPQGWVTALIVTIFVILLLQVLIGQILTPRILGDAVKIHPIVAILALFAGMELLGMGLLGGFIAVPLASVLQSILVAFWERWKETHPEEFPSDPGGTKQI